MRISSRTLLLVSVLAACGDDPGPSAPVTIASIDVSTAQSMAWIGAERQLTAVARSSSGATVDAEISWSSSASSVATVDGDGLVTAISEGTSTISASAENVTGSTIVTVLQVADALALTRVVDTLLAVGQARVLTAVVRDSGNVVIPSAAVRWSATNPSVATIDSITGRATAVGIGSTTVTARIGAFTRDGTLVVRDGTLVGERVLLTDYGNVVDNDYLIDDYFVVWWHPMNDYAAEARQILNWLKGVKAEATQMGLDDPPNDERGTYVNIYLHVPGPGNDNYPGDWGAGVGTDSNGLPFMSMGNSQRNDWMIFRHEGFHLFQYNGSRASPGFEYAGDGAWYVEATASWFAALPFLTDANAQRGAATVPANPQLAMWHGWTNAPPGDPANWNRTTRQYALSTWVNYLGTTGGVPDSVLVGGYVTSTTMLPQEYLNSRVSGLPALFADWAAGSTPDMRYLTRPQWTAALQDLAAYGDASDRHEFVLELDDIGTGGAFVAPPAGLRPRGWSYNVIRVASTQAASWRFEVDGEPTGSGGAAAAFQARLLVRTAAGDTVHTVPLANALDGSLEVVTSATPTEMYLIVAAVPMHFRGHQTYSYLVKVDRT